MIYYQAYNLLSLHAAMTNHQLKIFLRKKIYQLYRFKNRLLTLKIVTLYIPISTQKKMVLR